MNIVDEIINKFKTNNSLYIGEKVTISTHMIQTAMLAENLSIKIGVTFLPPLTNVQYAFVNCIKVVSAAPKEADNNSGTYPLQSERYFNAN